MLIDAFVASTIARKALAPSRASKVKSHVYYGETGGGVLSVDKHDACVAYGLSATLCVTRFTFLPIKFSRRSDLLPVVSFVFSPVIFFLYGSREFRHDDTG